MQIGNIDSFMHLSQFTDINDFNNNIEQWMLDGKSSFTKSELVALKRLIRFSAKVAGVCSAKIGTIVSATHEKDGAGISRSTFKRMVIKAKNLGLLQTHETTRQNGSKSSNLYVFNRFCGQAEPSKVEKLDQPKTSIISKTNNQNNNKRNMDVPTEQKADTDTKKNQVLDASFTSEKVPMQFTNLVRNFYDDARIIEEHWKLVNISAYKNQVTEGITDTAIEAFKALVRKIKFNNVNNTYGFFYGILNKKFRKKYTIDLFNDVWEACC
ncbi:hypothetical protein [Oceanobacillus halotolerans]|uniref:hypothetical protein n=1 Tax=Oceanobacillus halotolerans TaxID=2663380 RepID=UPI0013DA8C73|nr:hypothetical protein [Oceanobacillus halotolerans]